LALVALVVLVILLLEQLVEIQYLVQLHLLAAVAVEQK
jgi:hypothetical protein